MKNKKIIRFLRFLKENKVNVKFKKDFHTQDSVKQRRRMFYSRRYDVDTSKMNIFQYLHYIKEEDAIFGTISTFNHKYYDFWFPIDLEWERCY